MASGPLDVACSMFDTFCEDSDEVALLYDLDLRYVAINRAGLAALGLERSAVLGKTNRELLGDEGEAMEEKLRSVAARGAAQTWAHVVNGEAYETTYAPVVGAGGAAPPGRRRVRRDALRRAEAPRRRLTYRRRVPDGSYATVALAPGAWHRDGSGRLYVQESSVSQLLNEESIAFKQMYITRTAHDLKTPITSFRLALDQLDRLLDKSTSTDELALVEQARHATEFMQIIVRQAIDVGKLQAGQSISPTRGTVDLDGLLTKCDWLLAGYPKACSVSLGRDEARVSRYVVSDGEWLWEILMNFLTNACKYTASGGIDLRITTVTRRTSSPDLRNSDAAGAAEKTMLRVECADSGIGVPPAKRHGLFRPFGTLQAKTLHGTGIGLFNAAEVPGAHGQGRHERPQRRRKGSLFWAEVPYEPDDGPTPDDAASLQSPDAPTINHSPAPTALRPLVFKDRTALLVDDTGTILSLMVHIFQRKRFTAVFTVMTASNGADALEKLTRNAFDICLMDVQMPTMDGLECTRRLRAWEAGKATSDRFAAEEAGMDDFSASPSAS
ncbi:phosphorelay sensor kinase [Aureococcus anophagefferens]|nr:phosphorelay sensor kinase [Aureococcus anophagefferens]